jgi:hypothetical protein
MTGDQTARLREHLLELLKGGGAHLTFDKAIAGLPAELRGAKPRSVPHTPWRLLEHLRIAQWDILEFTRDPHHISPPWPEGYWPAGDARPTTGLGTGVCPPSGPTAGRCRTWWPTRPRTCSRRCRTGTGRRPCARRCWSPTVRSDLSNSRQCLSRS